MKTIKLLCVAGAAAMALNGCGGGGGSAGDTFGNGNGGQDPVSNVSSEKATQKAMSISSDAYNLDWSSDGVSGKVTVQIADTAGNPLPKGTKIQFSASGGIIDQTCLVGSEEGAGAEGAVGAVGAAGCTVNFKTSNPRPANGLVAVVAWLVGEEAYKDLNGNGKYDQGEPFYESGTLFRDDDVSFTYTGGADELVVGTSTTERKIGVGTSACREDLEAAPTEVPMSKPGTCDGVWGKTLVRAHTYLAVADSRYLEIVDEAPLDENGAALSGVWVKVFTKRGTAESAAPKDTKVEVENPGGCTATLTPATVDGVQVLPTYHRVTFGTGCATGDTVSIKASVAGRSTLTPAVVTVPAP